MKGLVPPASLPAVRRACLLFLIFLLASVGAGRQKMAEILKQIAAETPKNNPILGTAKLLSLRDQMAKLRPDATADSIVPLLLDLGEHELREGNIEQSIAALSRADRMIHDPDTASYFSKEARITVAYRLGIAFLRMGETANCAARHTADSCIMPLRGGGIHTLQEGSSQAIPHFQRALETAPENGPYYLKAQWLLNFAFMTLGQYPDKVPAKYKIDPKVFASEQNFPRFPNIAPDLHVNGMNLAGSVIADDFENDGFIDLMVSNWDPAAILQYFHNNGDGTFSNNTEQAKLNDILGGFNLIQADYNNDGFVDALVLRGAWLGDKGQFPKSLLRNNGNGTFTDVTFESGLAEARYPSQTAAWADFDHDGDLDLYIGNETAYGIAPPCQLFRNDGKGNFSDIAEKAGVTNGRFTKSVVWGDYDQDRDPDLYVSNLGQPNRLYRNNGNGTFTDVAEELGVTGPIWSFPSWFWDYNNDGALDLYVAWYDWARAGLTAVARSYVLGAGGEPPRLYQNDGKGNFQDVAPRKNLAKAVLPMGANFGDLDGDGYLDFYLGTGYPDYESLMPNVMYRNQEARSFADITTAGGFGHLQKGHGIAFADFDNDGDQDVFEQMGGFFRGDVSLNTFYQNPGFGNHWISLRLKGVQSNRSAIGARIHVVIQENGKQRSIYKHVNSGGSFGANPLQQNIGLGKAENILSMEVFWPTTGKTQAFDSVPMDQFLEITESNPKFEIRSTKQIQNRKLE